MRLSLSGNDEEAVDVNVDGEEDVDEISFMLPQSTMKLHNSTPLSFAQLNADYSIDNTIEKVE